MGGAVAKTAWGGGIWQRVLGIQCFGRARENAPFFYGLLGEKGSLISLQGWVRRGLLVIMFHVKHCGVWPDVSRETL